jgi:hypothetical protein
MQFAFGNGGRVMLTFLHFVLLNFFYEIKLLMHKKVLKEQVIEEL